MAQRVKNDWVLFWVILILLCFGLVMVYSASSAVAQQKLGSSWHYVSRQFFWALGSFAVMLPLRALFRWLFGQ